MNHKHNDSISGLYRTYSDNKSIYYDVFNDIFANYKTIKTIINASKQIDYPIGDIAVANHVLNNSSNISSFATDMIDYAIDWKEHFFAAVSTGNARFLMADVFALLLEKYSMRAIILQMEVSAHTILNTRYIITNIVALEYESAHKQSRNKGV